MSSIEMFTKYNMGIKSVQVQYDVYCDWQGKPPSYRLYVNGELFTERTFTWRDFYLEEVIPIDANPGNYTIRYEVIGNGHISARNPKVISGHCEFLSHDILRINNEG
jgi:hypothetical protein